MVEREQVRRQNGDEAVADESSRAVSGSTAQAGIVGEKDPELARRARFLEALDEVMRDHHNVLAALAK